MDEIKLTLPLSVMLEETARHIFDRDEMTKNDMVVIVKALAYICKELEKGDQYGTRKEPVRNSGKEPG